MATGQLGTYTQVDPRTKKEAAAKKSSPPEGCLLKGLGMGMVQAQSTREKRDHRKQATFTGGIW